MLPAPGGILTAAAALRQPRRTPPPARPDLADPVAQPGADTQDQLEIFARHAYDAPMFREILIGTVQGAFWGSLVGLALGTVATTAFAILLGLFLLIA